MKTIIAGSRSINDLNEVIKAIRESKFEITEVVSGCANGVDKLGERYAAIIGLPLSYYPADWATYGKSAGYIRNKEMAENSEALIAIWDGRSKGTKHMIDLANKNNLTVYIHMVCDGKKEKQ